MTFGFDPDAVGALRLGLGGDSPIYDETHDFARGGSDVGLSTPSLGAALTIGGALQAFVGDVHLNGFISQSRYQTIAACSTGSTANAYVGDVTAAVVNQHPSLPGRLEQPFHLAALPDFNLLPHSVFSFRSSSCSVGDPVCDTTGSLQFCTSRCQSPGWGLGRI